MRFLTGAIALAVGLLAPSAVLAAPQLPNIPVPNPIPVDYPGKTSAELEFRSEPDLEPRGPPGSCHSASNRACWTTGFNINTDFETSTPPPGALRKVRPHRAPRCPPNSEKESKLTPG